MKKLIFLFTMIVLAITGIVFAGNDLETVANFEEGSSFYDMSIGNRLLSPENIENTGYIPTNNKYNLQGFFLENQNTGFLNTSNTVSSPFLAYDSGATGTLTISLTPQEAIPATVIVAPFTPPPNPQE